MAKILLNIPDNPEDQSKKDTTHEKKVESSDKVQEEPRIKQVEKNQVQETSIQKTVSVAVPPKEQEDEFAIFPDWDVVPPNAIINPRIKKKV